MYQKYSVITENEKKSLIVVPSNLRPENLIRAEETEIVAQITVPSDGGCWAWVVLFAACINVFVLDACVYTYGALLPDIAKSLAVNDSLAAMINSIQVGFYFVMSPLAAALINRYGFRAIGMTGAIICSFGTFASYFTNDIASVIIFYGCFTGFGCSLICMTSTLIPGFYFEKIRSMALAIVSCGSSSGIMVMYPVNTVLVELAGWKTTILMFSGLYGITYFSSLTFRPLLSVTVAKIEDQGVRTVTYLPQQPSTAKQTEGRQASEIRRPSGGKHASIVNDPGGITPTTAQRVFGTVSNTYFPTAATVLQDEDVAIQPRQIQAETSKAPSSSVPQASRLVITTQTGISQRQLKQVKSIVSRGNIKDGPRKSNVEIDIAIKDQKKPTCCGRLCSWESNAPESRPMYKDDVFYGGNIKQLPAYQKSRADVPEQDRTGLEYQMAVSRAVTVAEISEKRGIFTTAVRRVLATMLDPKLLRRKSFLLLCFSGFLTYLGALVPYVFLQDRNMRAGMDPSHCKYFVSVLSFSNLIGKLVLSSLSMKLDVLAIYCLGLVVSGVCTIFSGVSYTLLYQYTYSAIFGFGISVSTCLRSVVIVTLYGLEALTNATGMVAMFVGIGNLFGTPLGAVLKDKLGYNMAFYVSGIFLVLAGLVATPMRKMSQREDMAAASEAADLKVPFK